MLNASQSVLYSKSFLTNLVSVLAFLFGCILPETIWSNLLRSAGLFALSGAITNWLAIHMLFERVPYLYGSGVIPKQFTAFKIGIKNLIMQEFFDTQKILSFLENGNVSVFSDEIHDKLREKIDMEQVYQHLVQAIMESNFAEVLKMFGGEQALAPLKQPIITKLEGLLHSIVTDLKKSGSDLPSLASTLHLKIETMVDRRLNELTPDMVKDIIQDMIRQHLGWLVVWGGVFGALIGIVAELAKVI